MEQLPEDPSLDPPHEDEETAMLNDLVDDAENASSDIDEYVAELKGELDEMNYALMDAMTSRDRIIELLGDISESTGDLDKSIKRNQI